MNNLSVVIIALNEADNLAPLMDALSWADEVLVIDSGSTDGTQNLCAGYPNCRIIEQPFLGYGPQKRFGVERARHDWILSIDADEVPDTLMQGAIRTLLRDGFGDNAGFHLSRRLSFLGREFRHGKESGQRILRLFDRRKGNYTPAVVHEKVEVEGAVGELDGRLIHNSYRDLGDYFSKFNRYTSLMAKQMYDRGGRAHRIGIVLRPPWVFLQYYLLRGNFLNGFAGFVYALLTAHYKTVKYLKLYELNMQVEHN
ncbi:MAG: glycosyltransferase family 2 protein [Gammaproteobacteria bacterium]